MRGTRTKYGSKKEIVDGITFDSKAEAARYRDLKLMERAGEIKGLRVHVPYNFVVNGSLVCEYEADFTYFRPVVGSAFGQHVVEDVKGMRSGPAWTVFRLKAKLFKALYLTDIEVYPPAVKKPRRRRA